MGTQPRSTTDPLKETAPPETRPARDMLLRQGVYGRLFRQGYLFDFYQAVRLLEKYFPEAPEPGRTAEIGQEQIVFRPDTALVFPGTDVKGIDLFDEDTPHPCVRLTVTFMGLYGIASPVPVYFYDELASVDKKLEAKFQADLKARAEGRQERELNQEEHNLKGLRDFLDIFNHRIYSYFYRAWKKYRPYVHTGTPDEGDHADRFLALTGLGTPGTLDRTPVTTLMRLATFAGRLAPRVRNADGLRALLAGLLGGVGVRIIQNVPRWVAIPERPRMGAAGGGMKLGITTTIGERVLDVSGKFRVVLGPMSFAVYQTYLPGRPAAHLLNYLVRLYAPDYLDYDVELHLDTSDIPPVRLGDGEVQVGMTAWLGQPTETVIALRMTYD